MGWAVSPFFGLRPFFCKAIDNFLDAIYVKCYAKATSSPLALSPLHRWRPKPHQLEIPNCHLPGSFPLKTLGFVKPATRTRGLPRGTLCQRCASLGGIPAHLVISAGESPPPVPVTPGREFPPLASTSGRESPPILGVWWILGAAQLGEPAAGSGPRRRCVRARSSETRRGGACWSPPGGAWVRTREKQLQLRTSCAQVK